ncbi:MAG: hypothetical protein IJZ76_05655 [Lachnospiraceae bacterium]|nr:hypothetical protein [Lachnospiraceae bacterium]
MIKKEWKNFVGSVVFLGIAAFLFVSISYVMRPVDLGNRDAMAGFYAEEDNTLDVVAFGSSAIYRFLNNPILWEEYGITSYNLGTGSQQPDVAVMLANETLKTQKPDLILVETRSFIKEEKEGKSDINFRRVSDYMNYSFDRIKYITAYTDDWSLRISMIFDICFYHELWKEFKITDLYRADNKKDTELKGWECIYECEPQEVPEDYSGVMPEAIDPEEEQELYELMDFCEAEEIALLFVATPWKMTENRVAQNKYLEQIITKRGYHFLNCNDYIDEIGIDYSKDFYDSMHTNVWGAEKVTHFIGKFMKKHFDMDLSHDEETVKEWNRVAESYHEKKQNGEKE